MWGYICLISNKNNQFPKEFEPILKMATDIIQGAIIREKLENLFFRSQKLESLGKLSGGIAHEFNNLFQIILGYTQLALTRDSTNEIKNDLIMILNTINKGSNLANKLLMFGKKNEIKKEQINLNKVIKEIKESLIKLTSNKVKIIFDLDENLKDCLADKILLEQILINLILNAKEAIHSEGIIRIKTKNIKLKEKNLINLPAGDYIELTIKDTGQGMTREVVEHIFEPFFTTKKNGTGLGLSAAYGIIKKLKGEIIVDSYPKKGTIFKIYLPAKDRTNNKRKKEKRKIKRNKKQKNYYILIIEDEKELGESLAQILKLKGHKVILAESKKEAIELLKKNEQVEIVISDINLPQGNGIELAKEITSKRPNIKVILMSGYNKEYNNLPQNCPLIKKPFHLEDLLKIIANIENRETKINNHKLK